MLLNMVDKWPAGDIHGFFVLLETSSVSVAFHSFYYLVGWQRSTASSRFACSVWPSWYPLTFNSDQATRISTIGNPHNVSHASIIFPIGSFPTVQKLESTHAYWHLHCILSYTLFFCGNEMPTRCNRRFYCRSYCLLNMFRAPLCTSSGAQEYYTVVSACGISCCGFQVAGLVWSWGFSL